MVFVLRRFSNGVRVLIFKMSDWVKKESCGIYVVVGVSVFVLVS